MRNKRSNQTTLDIVLNDLTEEDADALENEWYDEEELAKEAGEE